MRPEKSKAKAARPEAAMIPEPQDTEAVDAQLVPVAVAEIEKFDRGAIDVQIATAKQYPRDIRRCVDEATSMALMDEEVASSCFYVLHRKDHEGRVIKIDGPGVRLAEIVTAAWGNMRIAMDVLGESEDRRFVLARGFAWDLEKNVALAATVRRRITNKLGKRYSDDMIQTTGLAAAAIAMRNCVFKVVPMSVTRPIYLKAKALAVGDAQSLSSKHENAVKWLAKFGVGKDRMLATLKRPSVDAVTVDDMETLIGLITALKEGADADDLFPVVQAAEEHAVSAPPVTLAEKVAAKAAESKGIELNTGPGAPEYGNLFPGEKGTKS